MTDQINEYFEQGILGQAFQAECNILIWQHVADERQFLEKQNEEIKKLYSFIQYAAQTNYVLSLGKLFDTPSKRYPTRCILSFLELLKAPELIPPAVVETTNTIKAIKENNGPTELIDAVTAKDTTIFPRLLAKYYLEKYNDPILQAEIKKLKLMRDKAEAHNESIESMYLGFETTTELLNFALEIISVYGMAYRSEGWKINGKSFVTVNAERSAAFVKASIDDLKRSLKA
jgi:AbiU2